MDNESQLESFANDVIAGKEGKLMFNFISEGVNQSINYIISLILSSKDQDYLYDITTTVVKEFIQNANKANVKREYFKTKKWDINNPADYDKGMKSFNEEVIMKWNDQEEIMSNSSFFVTFIAKKLKDAFYFSIENNAPIQAQELERINKRLESAKNYVDLSDAFNDWSDSTESAGLGLIMSLLLLRNSGIGYKNMQIDIGPSGTTIASVTIPEHTIPLEITAKFKSKILQEAEGLPPLPQSLTKLIQLCNDPKSTLENIAKEIETNPALTAELIRLSNSALMSARTKSTTILQALKVVGIKTVKNLLYVSGVRKITDDRFGKTKDVWDHSLRVAYFAKQIATDYKMLKYSDLVSIGGILHDIGKLVLLSIDRTLFNKLASYQISKELSNTILLEEVSMGLSHSTLGSQLAKKWEFPSELSDMIEFHHRPILSPEGHRDICEIIYLANILDDSMKSAKAYYLADRRVLKKFKLQEEADFKNYSSKLLKSFNAELKSPS